MSSFNTTSSPQKFFAYKNYLYFIADDGVHGQELWVLRKSCLDSLNLSTPINSNSNYITTKAIVGQTANTISSTANVTYDAGKYVLLKPGFSTNPGAVFTSTIAGCLSTANLPNTNTESEPLKTDPKTEQYLQDMLIKPSIEDFIRNGNNKDLIEIWAKFEEGLKPLRDKEHQLNFELQSLEQQKPEAQIASNQEALNNYYTSKAQKQQAYQEAKQEAGQYGYIIVPVRDRENKKLGYDLTIYAAGKMHQSAIRY